MAGRSRSVKDKALAAPADLEELVRKRDAFITSMTMLRNAAEEASRAGLAYFDHVAGTASIIPTDISTGSLSYVRGMSMPPMPIRASTEEPESKRKRKREKRDPDMPKRPMTAYLLFCHEGRETVKKDLGAAASHKDIMAELTRRWKEMPDEEKKTWQEVYQGNRTTYEHDIAVYKAGKIEPIPAIATSTSGFTAVNQSEVETDKETDDDSDSTPEPVKKAAEPAKKATEPVKKATEPAKKAVEPAKKAAEPEPESEVEESEHEQEDEPEEESEEEEEAPPAKPKATPRSKRITVAVGKKSPNSAPAANSPAVNQEKKRERKTRSKRGEKEKEVVEEEPEKVTPNKRVKKRRKSSGAE
ncbi:hypothetical protein RUND412_009728 [Rhizina undulata]